MDKRWEQHKGINKQYLMKSQIKPPDDAKQRAEEMVYDEDVIRIFVDASELKFQGIFGIAVCFVGQGEVKVKSKKQYNQSKKRQIIFAELSAIVFALEQIITMYKEECKIPPEIIIYSDLTLLDQLSGTCNLTKNRSINLIVNEIRNLCIEFLKYHPGINLQIQTMKKGLKRHNPYYKAAHNAARKIIGY
ncbi:hypothetical protein CN481_14185 [Bacillus sp. AFS006103]|nr:hypothetical protein CN481_14185 [Bacillus sp. AFS006103]